MNLLEDRPLVLAIAPVSRGFGFAVLESIRIPIDWGVKEVRREKNAACLARAVKLLEGYAPAVLVLDDWSDRRSRRTFRVRSLLRLIAAEAEARGVRVVRHTHVDVRRVFATFGARTKDQIAGAVARMIPELIPTLPKPRKIWEPDHYAMAIFEAAALGIAYFALKEEGKFSRRLEP
jgi:Holliday junction resolvasome RuvABC endonuclease subunit